jgi:TPR repeat protein
VAFASALPTSPPAWTDEPPQLSRWIEAGWQSEQAHDPALAAAWYCRAARHGSAQAYHRLGMLLGAFSLDEVGQAAVGRHTLHATSAHIACDAHTLRATRIFCG